VKQKGILSQYIVSKDSGKKRQWDFLTGKPRLEPSQKVCPEALRPSEKTRKGKTWFKLESENSATPSEIQSTFPEKGGESVSSEEGEKLIVPFGGTNWKKGARQGGSARKRQSHCEKKKEIQPEAK